MAIPSSVSDRYSSLLLTVGKKVLSQLFPNDFEYYLISFELVDSKLRTVDYLTFPVMPDSIQESKMELTNVKKSAGGITSIITPSFVPREINIKGTFGRQFKFLLGATELNFLGLRFSTVGGVYKKEDMINNKVTLKNLPFSPQIKTGYGVMKVLEGIIDKATGVDNDNKPMSLYFYNPTLNNNYVIEPRSFQMSQEKGTNNMIWGYDLSFTAVAPLGSLQESSKSSLVRNFSFSEVNKSVNNLRSSIKVSL